METWLHQHIFKVGWLTTKNFQTTTILYYTFFLPGVVLYEVVYWLTAGLLNVRAERAIRWPEAQEVGQLKLNFVKLAPRAPALRVAIINTTPLLAGLLLIWYVANNVFQLSVVLELLVPLSLESINTALRALVRTPDFWLWYYLAFTIGNTMIPDLPRLAGYRRLLTIIGIAAAVMIVLGLGNAVIVGILGGPVASVLNALSGIFAAIITMNAFAVGILSAVENTIEWITGDSADFRNGKMITMTREERMERRMREIEKQRQARERRRVIDTIEAGPPSIYKQPLTLPGGPGDVDVTPVQRVVTTEEKAPLTTVSGDSRRAGANLIPGQLEGDDERRTITGGGNPQLPPSQSDEVDEPTP